MSDESSLSTYLRSWKDQLDRGSAYFNKFVNCFIWYYIYSELFPGEYFNKSFRETSEVLYNESICDANVSNSDVLECKLLLC